MERNPHQPNGGEQLEVNSYGTDDPGVQARIEQARTEASEQRRRDRARLEQLVEQGMRPDDAEALIEFEHSVRDQHERTAQTARATELAVTAASETEATPSYRPRVYVVDAANQRHGRWIDANQDPEQLRAEIAAMLASSPTAHATEWAIQSSEAFAGLDVSGFTDTELVSHLARGVAEHGAAYGVYVQIVGTDDRDMLDKFDDFYVGSYDSPEAWAREVGDDLEWNAQLDRVVDPMLRPYLRIDYARFTEDQRRNWDVLQGIDGKTHVFMR